MYLSSEYNRQNKNYPELIVNHLNDTCNSSYLVTDHFHNYLLMLIQDQPNIAYLERYVDAYYSPFGAAE